MNVRREIAITRLMLAITIVSALVFTGDVLLHDQPFRHLGQSAFLCIALFMVYGGLIYQFCRLAYFRRVRAHQAPTSTELDRVLLNPAAPTTSILIPSYKEELRIVEQTLLSAAFQTYPQRRVVVLIDDPPQSSKAADQRQRAATRHLIQRWNHTLSQQHAKHVAAYRRFQRLGPLDSQQLLREYHRLAEHYRTTSHWFKQQGAQLAAQYHADRFFTERIIQQLSERYQAHAQSLAAPTRQRSQAHLEREYHRLTTIFAADISCFERKRYYNLSQEPNKAMNLNSYIGLMGTYVREQVKGHQRYLREVPAGRGRLIPDSDYVITLDADSQLLPDYVLTLVQQMEQPGNQRIAVMQTPYSAFPGAPDTFERIAGATTDIQFIIHQGFTRYNATYWVGANALIRKTALHDIMELDTERGFPIKRFIQDRTVIEDTESSIDLVVRGWSLYNYPERLAYSATPPDYGSFLIQRRRWANGGLLIFPKLVRHLFAWPWRPAKFVEGLFRSHYLTSIAIVNAGQMIFILVPLTNGIGSLWLPLTAVPYFFLYHRDLRQLGYGKADILRVYALNMLLIPINIGGVIKSLHQGITRQKIAFGRTPKVHNRTAAPPLYHLTTHGLLGYSGFAFAHDALHHLWMHAAFSAANAIIFAYVAVRLIGLQATRQDVVGLLSRKHKPSHSERHSLQLQA